MTEDARKNASASPSPGGSPPTPPRLPGFRPSRGWILFVIALFAFNFGVEIGQLLVVLAVAFALALLRARSERAGRRLAVVGSVAVAVAGSFWFVQRVFLW